MTVYRAIYLTGPGGGWKDKLRLATAAVAGGAILIAAFILSLSLVMILVPVGLVAYLFRRQILRGLMRRAGFEPPRAPERPMTDPLDRKGGPVIEADYEIVEPRRPDRR